MNILVAERVKPEPIDVAAAMFAIWTASARFAADLARTTPRHDQ